MKAKTWIALLAIYLAWGSTYLGIRFAVETIPPFFMAGSRFIAAGLTMYLWRRMAGDPPPTLKHWRSAGLIGLFLLVGGNGIVSWVEQFIESGIAALIVGSAPMWMVLIEALRPGGSRPGRLALTGLLIGFAGITLLVAPSDLSTLPDVNWQGTSLLLLAAFLWSVGSVISKTAELHPSVLMNTAIEMLVGAAGLYLVGLFLGEAGELNLTAISTRSWLSLGYLTIVGSLIGFTSYVWLLENVPLSIAGTYAYVNPLIAVLLGSWLAQETLTPRTLLAAVIIVGSVALINTERQRETTAEAHPAVPNNSD
ncbi:MAG: EamA family transporter [Anaerolineales bacterium]|nr:EamA family transporter [Anaerolineales bacterium]